MKGKFLPCLLALLVGLVGGLVYNFFSLGGTGLLPSAPQATLSPASPAATPPAKAPDLTSSAYLLERGSLVLDAVKAQDYTALAAYVHPEAGVTFTTFSTVDPSVDLTFTAEQLAAADGNDAKYLWGYGHGSGEKIELTITGYFKRYVFAADYTKAPLIGVNYVSSPGNSLENVAEAYPGDSYLEYYFPGQDPKNGGLDWSALKLVFREYKGALRLVGVIHSEWTI